jgi:hypothetical protein
VRGWFDRRGEYLYELRYEHKGFEEITFEMKIASKESEERIREFPTARRRTRRCDEWFA